MTPSILETMQDAALFGCHFKDQSTWMAWRVFCAALFGLPIDESERRLFRKCTGRHHPQPSGYQEAWLCIGRRGGKSFVLALIATYLACFRDWRPYLAPGERATIMVIAADRKQARVIMRYCKGLILNTPMLASMVESETSDSISLRSRVVVEVHTASFKTTRGYTLVAALCDEIAFWPTEDAAEPDFEVINALRPGMATIPGAMLLCGSSPYGRRGALWEAYRHYYGKDGPLIWRAPTRTMNTTVPESVIAQAMERDPASASAEYLAEFRSDIEGFVLREVVDACVTSGVFERPPQSNHRYVGFVDPSGGSSDSMTLGIAHREADQVVLDAVREVRPPFSPESVVSDFAQLCKTYRVNQLQGDRYAGVWPVEQFCKRGLRYEQSANPKSQIYGDLLPLLNSRRVELLDHPRLCGQLASLERRTARSGKDSIDHAPHQHDDLINAAAGALVLAHNAQRQQLRIGSYGCGGGRIIWNDLESERCRVRSVKVPEKIASASRGIV